MNCPSPQPQLKTHHTLGIPNGHKQTYYSDIKRVFLSFIMVLAIFTSLAQSADKDLHLKVANTIKKEFNAGNYKGIYKMLDADLQKQFSESALISFFKDLKEKNCSLMQSIAYKGEADQHHYFQFSCLMGSINLLLNCDKDQRISFMSWVPAEKVNNIPPSHERENITAQNKDTSVLDTKIDSIVNMFMLNPANCGLSIAVYQNKKITYHNYGSIKRGANQLPTNKTIYEIGSISKTFTGILFARAILDKKLALNDPVKKYLGETYTNLAYKGKEIELVHLANHTGRIHRVPFNLMGQPNYDMNNPYKNYSKEMVLQYMKIMKPDTFPGIKNEYSNLGMALLGIIEEKVYNKTYEELITEYICKPLGMNDTKITVPASDTSRFAKGYSAEGNRVPYWDLGALAGAGGIRSTTEDMINYVKANMEENDPALKLSHQTTFMDNRDQIALAWHITKTKKGNDLVWHNGRTGGFGSFCGFIKTKDVAVVVLANSSNPVDQIAIGILKFLQ